jgi:hypothetical protein
VRALGKEKAKSVWEENNFEETTGERQVICFLRVCMCVWSKFSTVPLE